jgi:tRNA (cytidine/uridine-2'-O-)-methyltransferase
LGFRIDDRTLKRAGIDYWHLVQVHRHLDFAHFRHALPEASLFFFSAKSDKSYTCAPIRPGDAIIFGRESVGLPSHLTDDHPGCVYSIPTMGAVRSLNLANAVSIVAYEALRRLGALDRTFQD